MDNFNNYNTIENINFYKTTPEQAHPLYEKTLIFMYIHILYSYIKEDTLIRSVAQIKLLDLKTRFRDKEEFQKRRQCEKNYKYGNISQKSLMNIPKRKLHDLTTNCFRRVVNTYIPIFLFLFIHCIL